MLKGKKMSKKISFHFQPNLQKEGKFLDTMIVEKEIDGKKKRYFEGISSGLKKDAHKERVSDRCIKKFMEQANSGDMLLFPDIHGIKQSEDIGILEKATILENGDWWTSYRLYDEDDDPGQYKLEKINNLWKQCMGLPPYKKKKQMGFSIEGIIPEENGIIMSSTGDTILDDIQLDGVVLVPRPAYMDSIANAVYKALDILPPWREEKVQKNIQGKLNQVINEKELKDKYWSKKYDVQDALSQTIEEIMLDAQDMKIERLSIVFDEYKTAMINLLMESQAIFQNDDLNKEVTRSINAENDKARIFKSIDENIGEFRKIITRRLYG
jgi:hypothetical protein